MKKKQAREPVVMEPELFKLIYRVSVKSKQPVDVVVDVLLSTALTALAEWAGENQVPGNPASRCCEGCRCTTQEQIDRCRGVKKKKV